ncbi:MAG: biotin transporter BioY [Clostridia bacterium]|nr:biotin transporter BioY [Clostridia bacterium]
MTKAKKTASIQNMAMTAVMTAVLAVLAQVAIPLPTGVPITMQTFAVALIGAVLGVKNGLISYGVYILLGVVGVPVFANLKSGISVLLGVTGGFLFGFALLVLFSAIGSNKKMAGAIFFGALGLFCTYALGCLQFAFLMKTSIVQAIVQVCLPYLVKDIISVIVAFIAGRIIRGLLQKIRR